MFSNRKKISRRDFVFKGGAFCGAIAMSDALLLEPSWLKLSKVTVPVSSELIQDPIRILHLSDLHLHSISISRINKAVELGLSQEPDIVCITGDFISGIPDTSSYGEVLEKLSKHCPTFAVKGNHDGGSWVSRYAGGPANTVWLEEILGECGINLLSNSGSIVECGGQSIFLCGVPDLWTEIIVPDLTFASSDPKLLSIVMAHNPDSKDQLREAPWDIMLSGHTHGGELNIPILGATPFAPVKDRRFIRGLYEWEGRQLHITAGVGTLVGRFNCRPEVSILDLTPLVGIEERLIGCA